MLVLVAFGIVKQGTRGQAEDRDQLQERKAAAGFLAAGLRISPLVFRSVGQAGGGAVDEFDPQAVPEVGGFFSGGGGGHPQPLERVQGQSLAGLAIRTGTFVQRALPLEGQERLDLADDFTAGAVRIEDLIEEGKEGSAQAVDAIPAVGALLGLGEQARWQAGAKEEFQVGQALLAERVDASAQGGQACPPSRKKRCAHMPSINTVLTVDSQCKMRVMRKKPPAVVALKRKYQRLRQSLAQIGYISRGSVLERSLATSGRSGYQWTRKVAQKTVTVALSRAQFEAMKRAVANERMLWKTIQKMETLSRQILFGTVPDTRRRKPLAKKVLGLI